MLRGAGRGGTQRERLEAFYAPQAEAYDRFREKLLHGRAELIADLPVPAGGRVAEIGGGTGRNLEFFGDRIGDFGSVEVADLCPSLLTVARERAQQHGWHNVTTIECDACTWTGAGEPLDAIYFSYALTMIPDWFAAIDRALERLRPGGHLGVVDFYLPRKFPSDGRRRMGGIKRTFWRAWFAHDDVFLSSDHLPYLERHLETVHLSEHQGRVPYLCGLKAPYYRYIGRKPA